MTDQSIHPPLANLPDDIAEAIAAYALDALPPEDEARIVAYIAAHPEADALLEEYRSIVGLIPYAAAPSAPPPYVRDGVLRSIRGEQARRRRLPLPRVRYRFVPAFAACALLLLLVWNIGLQVRPVSAPAPDPNPNAPISDILSQHGADDVCDGSAAGRAERLRARLPDARSLAGGDGRLEVAAAVGGPDLSTLVPAR